MTETMRALRFHDYGEPTEVLRLEEAEVREPGTGRIRVAVRAAGLAPADWALCRGLFPGTLPRGVGCDVAGVVDAVGEGVAGVAVGDEVFGTADWAGSPSAGAADAALMNRWFPRTEGLDPVTAAALPMTVDTAYTHLHALGMAPGASILVHGAGSTIGFAAVQMALLAGMRVIATAGATFAGRLRGFGAIVTDYGDGMADRVLSAAGGPVDLALDTAPVGGALPELVRCAGGDPAHVMTVADFPAAAELGVRTIFTETGAQPADVLPEYAELAARGRFAVPIAGAFPLGEWRTAAEISLGGHARGKLVLLPGRVDGTD